MKYLIMIILLISVSYSSNLETVVSIDTLVDNNKIIVTTTKVNSIDDETIIQKCISNRCNILTYNSLDSNILENKSFIDGKLHGYYFKRIRRFRSYMDSIKIMFEYGIISDVKMYYKNVLIEQKSYKNGKKDGLFITTTNDYLKEINKENVTSKNIFLAKVYTRYVDGLISGPKTQYYYDVENNNLYLDDKTKVIVNKLKSYNDCKSYGIEEIFYKNGNIKSRSIPGNNINKISYFENGNVKSIICNIPWYNLDTAQSKFRDDIIQYFNQNDYDIHHNDFLIIRHFYKNGNIKNEIDYNKNKQDGMSYSYNMHGDLISSTLFTRVGRFGIDNNILH